MKYRESKWREYLSPPLANWRIQHLFDLIEFSFGITREALIELMFRNDITEPISYLEKSTDDEIMKLIDSRPKARKAEEYYLRTKVFEWFEGETSPEVDALACELCYRNVLFWGERRRLLHAGEILTKMKTNTEFEREAARFVYEMELTKTLAALHAADSKR
jgi:hypothetical protein